MQSAGSAESEESQRAANAAPGSQPANISDPVCDDDTTVRMLRERIAAFVRDRDWDQFHKPKDLSIAIAIEAAELMELFLWKSSEEVDHAIERPETRQSLEEELADVVILSLNLADRLQIDVASAVVSKLAANELKYPANVVRGRAEKYTHFRTDP
jgi:dCTP diphosphatase